ncbi:MAG: ATP-binding protein [Ignavibacteria bacterium]|nr:ATP-binding protein [Ignavibacteria bacterium]
MKKYSSVVFASIIAIVTIFSIVFVYQTLTTFKDHFVNFQIKELSRLSKVLEKELVKIITSDIPDKSDFKKFAFYCDSLLKVRVTIIDSGGVVLADSREKEEHLENHRNRPEILKARVEGEGFAVRFSKTLRTEYIYYAKKISISNNNFIFFRTSIPKENLNAFFLQVQEKILIVFSGLFVSIVVLSYVLSRTLTKPIIEVIEASRKVASGNFDCKLDENGDSELSILKRNFNEMVSEMKKSLDKLVEQRNFMNNLIDSLDQAVAIIDEESNIVFANRYYKTLLLKSHQISKISNSIKDEIVLKQILDSFSTQKDTTVEIEIADKVYLSSIKHLIGTNQIIHFLYDITPIKKVESIKKDLVANVSHELRTPLTAIKGYLETLEEEIPCEQFKYLDTIKRHTERIIHIVDDLLTLVALEDASSKLFVSEVDLCELVKQVLPTFKQKLEEKNLSIEIKCEEDFPKVNVDSFRMEQVFINLIDNAIKYSDKGTIRIEFMKNDEESVKIIVSDEGIGIPKEHQDRIFERFYTVDKSHSRRYGGTGLGLSIVKHIILLHDGNIQVESEKGKGTKFIIHLPIN